MKWLAIAMCAFLLLWSAGCKFPCQEVGCWILSEPDSSSEDTKWIFAFSSCPDKEQLFVLTDRNVMVKISNNGNRYYINCSDFSFPYDMAVNDKGEIFVVDTGHHVIKRISKTGRITIFAGQNGVAGFHDGRIGDSLFQWPSGIAVDRLGNIIVADSGNNAIRRISPAGKVETLAGRGADSRSALFEKEVKGDVVVCKSRDGGKAVATLRNPIRVAVDKKNHIYILCSALNETHFDNMVRRLDPDGSVVTLAGETHVEAQFFDGNGRTARLFDPKDIAVDSKGNIYVIDDKTIRKISCDGDVMTVAGSRPHACSSSKDGRGPNAVFHLPTCLEIDCNDNLYIGDGATIREMSPRFVVTTLFDINE